MRLKIPVWLKSVLFGFVILELGTKLWSIIAVGNIRLSPDIPWSFPLMTIFLVLAWKYLDGKWIPKSTQKARHMWMRANSLTTKNRIWAWISASLLGGTILCLIILGIRIMDVPSGQVLQIERIINYPVWTIVSLIIMTSLVAGIVEEIAFRGYMQKPMEMKYGPKVAILVVALFFTILHLPNVTITPYLIPIFFIGSIGWGVLAYLTNSIIPGVVIHCTIDVLSYLWIWRNLEFVKTLSSESIMETGIDVSFLILILITLSLSILVILTFRKLVTLNNLKL
jgi:membrane protease YdiL (CAAX protease family)